MILCSSGGKVAKYQTVDKVDIMNAMNLISSGWIRESQISSK